MARSFLASATFCSPCSQAAEPNSKPRVAPDGVLAKDRGIHLSLRSPAWVPARNSRPRLGAVSLTPGGLKLRDSYRPAKRLLPKGIVARWRHTFPNAGWGSEAGSLLACHRSPLSAFRLPDLPTAVRNMTLSPACGEKNAVTSSS